MSRANAVISCHNIRNVFNFVKLVFPAEWWIYIYLFLWFRHNLIKCSLSHVSFGQAVSLKLASIAYIKYLQNENSFQMTFANEIFFECHSECHRVLSLKFTRSHMIDISQSSGFWNQTWIAFTFKPILYRLYRLYISWSSR